MMRRPPIFATEIPFEGTPPCQTSCRPIMIAESPHRIDIYEPKCVFN
jgi:hypothetical protein